MAICPLIGDMMHKILNVLAAVAALGAAGLWFYASVLHVPTDIKSGYGSLVGVEEMSAGFSRQGFWNAVAAAMTGLAVLTESLVRGIITLPRQTGQISVK